MTLLQTAQLPLPRWELNSQGPPSRPGWMESRNLSSSAVATEDHDLEFADDDDQRVVT